MAVFINIKALFGENVSFAQLFFGDIERVGENSLDPELPIREVVAYYAPGYGVCLGVITVSIDTGFDKFNLRDSKERPAALEDLVREVNDKGVCQQGNSDSKNTLLGYLLGQRSMKNIN